MNNDLNIKSFQEFIDLYKTHKTYATHAIAVKIDTLSKEVGNANMIMKNSNKHEFSVENIISMLISIFDKYNVVHFSQSHRDDKDVPYEYEIKGQSDRIEFIFHFTKNRDIGLLEDFYDDLKKECKLRIGKDFIYRIIDDFEDYTVSLDIFKV